MIRRLSKKLLLINDDSHSEEDEKQTEEMKYKLDVNDPNICKDHYPRYDFGFTITLRDNRKLGYMIYGAINNYKATIILLPGSPGTRLFNHEPHDALNKTYAIRLIVIDRPGIGLSSKHDTYDFKSHATDIHELVQQLDIKTYHIAAYSAGGPFACAYCALYSQKSGYRLKSYQLIAGVGPSDTPNSYGQMTMFNKFAWFLVRNSSQNIITFCANQSAKTHKNTPITGLIKDFSDSPYDECMIKNTKVIKSFLMSKYETECVKTGQDSENRLLVLYGHEWDFKLDDIKCPLVIYNGTCDYGCVPNMAKYIFECVSGTNAPKLPIVHKHKKHKKEKNEDNSEYTDSDIETDDEWDDADPDSDDDNTEHKPTSKVSVTILDDEDETQIYATAPDILNVDKNVLLKLENEYNENEKQQNVNNKQCTLIWGHEKGHLWFFEEDLWREVVFRALFMENKPNT